MDVLVHWVRAHVRTGHAPDAEPAVALLRSAVAARPLAGAYLPWAEGLAAIDDPALAAARLADAVERFRARERPIGEIECLLDLADARDRAGTDGDATRAAAAALAERTGALLFTGSAERE
jgi:hypothetical protein